MKHGTLGNKNKTLGNKNRTLHCVRRCGPRRSSEDMKTRRHEENACLSSCLHVFMSSFECCPWPLSSRRLVGRKGWPLHFSMDVLANLLTLLDHGVASMTVYVYVYVYVHVCVCACVCMCTRTRTSTCTCTCTCPCGKKGLAPFFPPPCGKKGLAPSFFDGCPC